MLDFSANAFGLFTGGTVELDSQTGEIVFNGSNANLRMADDPGWVIGAQEFCIEMPPLKFSDLSGIHTLISQYDFNGDQRAWRFRYNGNLELQWSTDGGTPTSTLSDPGTLSTGVEYMLAVERDDSDVIRIYVDGAVVASTTSADSFNDSSAGVRIGASEDSGSATEFFAGRMRGLPRVTIGAHRYGGAYTPPTMPWPTQ